MKIINISGYKFLHIHDVFLQREKMYEKLGDIGLLGKVMISYEGINIMLSGDKKQIKEFYFFIKKDLRFTGISFKKSYSDYIPFNELKIKCKNCIVPSKFDIFPTIQNKNTITPKIFKWLLDYKKNITILDIRNKYEIDKGFFYKSIHLNINQFRDIYTKLKNCSEKIKNIPTIMYCTGGIRCEKAIILAKKANFKNVYQVNGGILQYFKDIGQKYFQGRCFVFDNRESITAEDVKYPQ